MKDATYGRGANTSQYDSSDSTNHYFLDKSAINDLSCSIRILDDNLLQVYNGPSGPQIREPRLKTKSFVPCYFNEEKIKYPKMSGLSSQKHCQYLALMKMFKSRTPNTLPSDQENVKKYMRLHEEVMAERYEFIQFVKQNQVKERYLFISSEVKKYVDELWKYKLSQVYRYPALYKPLKMVSLVYTDSSNRAVSMKLLENVLEQGSVPLVVTPKFNSAVRIRTYRKFSKNRETYLQKVPVSEDKTAEDLAVKKGADVVISASALRNIVDNHNPYARKTGQEKRIVFVDKPFPPLALTNVEKNLWCYKNGVKVLFCQQTGVRLGEKQIEKQSSENIAFDSKSCIKPQFDNPESAHESDVSINDNLVNATSDIEETSAKRKITTSEEKSGTPESGLEETPAKKVKYSLECQSSSLQTCISPNSVVTRSKTRLQEKMELINRSLGDNNSSSKELTNCDVSKKNLNFDSQQSIEESDVKDIVSPSYQYSHNESDESDIDNLVIDLSDVEKTPSVKKKMTPECKSVTTESHTSDLRETPANNPKYSLECHSSSPQSSKQSTSPNNVMTRSKSRLQEKIEIINKSFGDDYSSTKGLTDCDVSKNRLRNSALEQSVEGSSVKDFVTPSSCKNVNYKLWKLCKEDNNEKSKENLMKHNLNLELKVLVRCSINGYEVVNGAEKQVHLATKLEHQTEFGAECLTQIRVDVCTTEVMMIERLSLEELLQNNDQKFSSSTLLQTLYTVLCGLTNLEPGNYILNHPQKSTFAKLKKHSRRKRKRRRKAKNEIKHPRRAFNVVLVNSCLHSF
ncbi:hypothetical protein C0J52_24437 [Blattella germanica]|nr:hypothetical protein C0J52_24437 [Blattella germanica]